MQMFSDRALSISRKHTLKAWTCFLLFFNLFLERIITFLAYILRAIHDRKLKAKGDSSDESKSRRNSQISDDEQLDTWKPSVYWVMLILLLGAMVVACCASAMYYPVEDWTYFEAIYFCFVDADVQ
jgi:uncharacterized membrane protein